jgi:hypothetical protein
LALSETQGDALSGCARETAGRAVTVRIVDHVGHEYHSGRTF